MEYNISKLKSHLCAINYSLFYKLKDNPLDLQTQLIWVFWRELDSKEKQEKKSTNVNFSGTYININI